VDTELVLDTDESITYTLTVNNLLTTRNSKSKQHNMSLPSPSTGSSTAPDPSLYAELEGPLIELAHRSNGDLRKLLTVFFGFLHRRTDFYCIASPDNYSEATTDRDNAAKPPPLHSIGFREGEAEKLLLAAFRQFPLRRVPPRPPPPTSSPSDSGASPSKASAETVTKEPLSQSSTKAKKQSNFESDLVQLTEEGLQIPVGNGGSTDRYKWTQTIDECTVLVAIPEGIRGRDLQVELQSDRILVCEKVRQSDTDGSGAEPRIFLEGPLTHRIVPSESTWTLESGVLQTILYKLEKTFWDTVVVGDAQIDTDLVDSRRNIDTYDASTQAQIRKIMFDQQQSAKGLPTSDELSGKKPSIPPLPAGVEFIDQEILDAKMKALGK
jgi:N-terminal conserved domain of Nudc./CS domain